MRLLALPLLMAIWLPLAAAEPIVVEPTGDADAEFLAVSGTGDAHSSCTRFGTVPCAAASGTGNTTGAPTRVEAAHLLVCVTNGFGTARCLVNGNDDAEIASASLEGDAAGGTASASSAGSAEGTVIAIGRDEARGSLLAIGEHSAGGLALARGDAHGVIAIGGGNATGFLALALTGEANAEGCLATPLDPCHEGVALSAADLWPIDEIALYDSPARS